MRIAFLTSSLAPGKDGVGDYTRDLAAACERLGRSCVLLALNDRHIDRQCEQWQGARGTMLETLRMPASAPWSQRLHAAQLWLQSRSPDWISLQFVAYGFDAKGLVGDLGRRLAPLIDARPLHMMLHELWIGMERGAPLRQRLIGSLQRRAVLAMMRRLKPAIVHTSNVSYARLLQAQGIEAQLLPLCGSIPVASSPDMQWLGRELIELGVPESRAVAREHSWRFGMFGSLHPAWSPEPLFTGIAEAARGAGRQVIIASVGRCGPGHLLWQDLRRHYGERFSFAALGERSERDVSVFLQSIDFGLALTPWALIGKSATAAAMVDHGLPVIVSRDDVDYGLGPAACPTPLLYRMDADLPHWLFKASPQPPRALLADMTDRFVADIDAGLERQYRGIDVLRQAG
jgi:hypothetical protein